MLTDAYLCHLFVLALARLPVRSLKLAIDEPPSRYWPRVRA